MMEAHGMQQPILVVLIQETYSEMHELHCLFQVPISVISAMGDEFMSCDRYYENRRESRVLEAIPCDMSKVSFCKHKGSSYPE